jgi:hypothetical protein
MALPSTNLSLDDIYEESTPGYNHPNPLSFTAVTYLNWTEGNAGSGGASQTLDFNPYSMDGQPISPLGADVLYNFPILDAGTDPTSFAEYQNNQYFFDGTTFDIKYEWNNPLTNSLSPPPPIINDVDVTVKCYDYNMVYKVHNDFSINALASTSGGPNSIPGGVTTSPLVENVYWEIDVSVDPTNNSITNIAFQVNGTTRYNTGAISGLNNFTWQSAGASAGVTNSSGIVYNIVVS